ncbi:hypothetical protein NPD5_3864 [Clostridium sporogenes]|uniref:Uncharacterized protein n=1 Tax=Clostridium sporogenes TaxID=1509 RepID=A0A1L3NBU1_CLOSG|nr:hypothetical protein [Clostridium sporogenes]APH13592.1 hypothetical protein NPD5_3864 [Clostridium sporogenes]
MSTSIDVYKIPVKYKSLEHYENEHLEYEDEDSDYENLIFTICGFNRCNLITELFDITYSKQIPPCGNGIFEGKYIITLEEFLKAKNIFFNKYKEKDFDYINEQIERFFIEVEPIIKIEKKMYFEIG